MIDDAFRILARERPAPDTNDINLYLYAARHSWSHTAGVSIDNFIDSHRGNEAIALCGKLAIVRSIVEAEKKKSKLYVDQKNSHNKLRFADVENTWFNAFFQLLTENCDWSELPGRLAKVAIVTFNYDRCIRTLPVPRPTKLLRSFCRRSCASAGISGDLSPLWHRWQT